MPFRFFPSAAIIALLLCAQTVLVKAEDRIRLPVAINGKEEAFIFDTGFGGTFGLYRSATERIGLKITPPPEHIQARPGRVLLGQTEACAVTLLSRTESVPLMVLDTPSGVQADEAGLVGWPVLSREIVRFRPVGNVEQVTIETALPRDLAGWLKVRVIRRQILTLEIPAADGTPVRVNIDTGASSGVALQPERFRAWRSQNAGGPATLEAFWQPASGLMVREEVWAGELNLGRMLLHNVPVDEGTADEFQGGPPDMTAVVGMAALRRMDLVVDGRNDVAYVRPSQTSTATYNHNRMGAVFVPRDIQSLDLVATVVPHSPAEQAGVRAGDVLLKIDSLNVTAWQTQPGIMPLSRFWARPPGTRLMLTLKRNNQTIVIPVILRDILGPGSQEAG